MFSIVRPGGDLEGPVTVQGSAKAWPNYVDSASTAWLNATVDDSDRGNSTVSEAEYFIQCTEPEQSDFGTGTSMLASDATFDSPLEDVTWSGILGFTSGYYTLWVHGKDSAGNWGTFDSQTFLVLDLINPADQIAPAPAPNVTITLEGASLENLNLTWDASPDDDGNPSNVEVYDIFYSESYATGGAGYGKLTSIPATGAPSYGYLDALKGNGDPKSYYYYISARDMSCNVGANDTQIAKFSRTLTAGHNIVSVPLALYDDSIDVVLQTLTYEAAWSYDATDPADPWKSYNPSRPFNDLSKVNRSMALWINVPADSNMVVVGEVPDNTTIQLITGWNFVGFPSLMTRTVSDAMSGVSYDKMEGFDSNPPDNMMEYLPGDSMVPGYGYWLTVNAPTNWTVEN
jgi:hypothetical protein